MKPFGRLIFLVCETSLIVQLASGTPAVMNETKPLAALPPGCSCLMASYQFADRWRLESSASPLQGRDPKAIWQQIKSLAEAEVSSGSRSFTRPSFTTKVVGSTRQLNITKGDVSDLGFGDDPYKNPFKEQILIEALRRALTEARLDDTATGIVTAPNRSSSLKSQPPANTTGRASGNAQWQCYLDQAEQLVRQGVVAIETISNKDQLKQFLQRTQDQIDELLYNQLFESIEQYAEHNRYNVIYDRGGTVKAFSVSINSVPDGAKVWLMTDLVYRKQLITNTEQSQWPWREIVQNPADLIGKYRYMAVWPDGRRAEGTIEVNSAAPLKLLPQ